jgi:hypothetical protein
MQLAATVIAAMAAIAADIALFSLRCDASPPVSVAGLAVALLAQMGATLLVYWGMAENAVPVGRTRFLSVVQLGLLLLLCSLPAAHFALNYSDAIGHPNWYKSVGLQCRNP